MGCPSRCLTRWLLPSFAGRRRRVKSVRRGRYSPVRGTKHVPDRTEQRGNLDGQQPQLHPTPVRPPGIRLAGRTVARERSEGFAADAAQTPEALPRDAAAVLPELLPRLRRLRCARPRRHRTRLGGSPFYRTAPVPTTDDGGRHSFLRPLPISAEGDAGRGCDPQGIRRGALGRPPGPRGPRHLRCRSRRRPRVFPRQGDAVPRDARTDPQDPNPNRTAPDAPKTVSLSWIPIGRVVSWPVH